MRLITIDRAAKMNSLDFAAQRRAGRSLAGLRRRRDARVASSPAPATRPSAPAPTSRPTPWPSRRRRRPDFRERYTEGRGLGGITRGLDIDKPLVAAVNGYAISGGLEIALACDLRFCSPNAEFALQDSKWGFHACDGGLMRLPMIVGLGHAMEMILSGERVDADHACASAWSTASGRRRSCCRHARLRPDAGEPRAAGPPLRQGDDPPQRGPALRRGAEGGVRSFHDLAMTADLEEGFNSFRERRDAVFVGR